MIQDDQVVLTGQTMSGAAGGYDQASRLRALVDAHDRGAGRESASRGVALRAPGLVGVPPIIAIASGKGGVGKTVCSVHLARALCRLSMRVSLLDADHGMANADLLLGVEPGSRLGQAVCHATPVPSVPGLRLVAGAVGRSSVDDADQSARYRKQVRASLEGLGRSTDVFVVDLGAGVDRTILGVLACARLPIIMTTPEPPAIADAYALYKSLATLAKGKRRLAAILINLARDGAEALDVYRRFAATSERFLGCRPPLIGWLPHDRQVVDAVRSRRLAEGGGRFDAEVARLAVRCRQIFDRNRRSRAERAQRVVTPDR